METNMQIKPIIPFEPKSARSIPQEKKWVAQVKWDGVRVLTYFDGNNVRLFNRRLNERTLQYPELVEINKYCNASSVVLDGEIISLENGVPSFQKVMKRDSVRTISSVKRAYQGTHINYMIFDVLFYNGNWITDQPLKNRQEVIMNIIKTNDNVQVVHNFEDPKGLFNVIKERGMEGIICKDLNKSYVINGKDDRWQKVKNFRDIIAVVGGASLKHGMVNSLLLGLYDNKGNLQYIGHIGTGKLTKGDWNQLTEIIKPFVIKNKPFANNPERVIDTLWLEPHFTVKVQFMEWTKGRTLRQPSIQSFVSFPSEDCTFEQE